jgi:hypothetical protein
MEKAIKIVKELQKAGIIEDFAIGGGIATVFYIEPVLTYDLDIFYIQNNDEKKIISLSPIYNFLKRKGYSFEKEHIVIEGTPVQFIPVYNDLVKEAVENAKEIEYKKTPVKVLKAEYLIAIMLQTFRPKDKERIIKILTESKINKKYLEAILNKYNLHIKFDNFIKLYYAK